MILKKIKYSSIFLSIFILIYSFVSNSSPLHAQIVPRCTILPGTYWANVEFYVSTTNNTQVPSSLSLNPVQTGSCSNANSINTEDSNYDPTSFGQSVPNIGFIGSSGTVWSGSHSGGTPESITRGGNSGNSNISGSTNWISYNQIFDCAYGYVTYTLSGLPAGWTVSSTSIYYESGSSGSALPGQEIPIFNPLVGSDYQAQYTSVSIYITPPTGSTNPPSPGGPTPTATPVPVPTPPILPQNNPTTNLTINGSIVGYKGIVINRDLGTQDLYQPSVVVNYNTSFLTNTQIYAKSIGDIIQYWLEPPL